MHYFEFADKDTTLYEASSSLNAGLDEVLEIQKNVPASGANISVSRILISFDLNYISGSISSGLIPAVGPNPASSSFFLNLFDANPTALATSQSIFAYPISGSWIEGDGRSYDNPTTTEGASWNFRDGATVSTLWRRPISASGGLWFEGPGFEASMSFNKKTKDVRMNVTDIVDKFIKGTVPNNGFIVKRSGSVGNTSSSLDEGSTDRFGNLSFFSSDTHTKYPPTLEAVWDDSKWVTGSLSALSSTELEDLVVYMKGLRPEYKENSKAKFRLVGRTRFPEKTFSTTPSNLTVKYLPSGSTSGDGAFYSIVDAETDDVVVPFGSGSKVSCDSTGNYFNVWMNGYQPERYYTLQYKIVSGSGTADETNTFIDEGFTFKVSL